MSPAAQLDLKTLNRKSREVSAVLKGLAHPTRLRILCRLCDGPATVQELEEACGLSQAQTSQFLARLRSEGHVKAERDGQHVIYSLADRRTSELISAVAGIYCKPEKP